MSDENQIVIPRSFIDLFIPPGAIKPTEARDTIAARYELCEDMAQMLTEPAKAHLFDLRVTEQDVLERIQQGLLVGDPVVTAVEAHWVMRRLAELLQWAPLDRPVP